MNSSLVSIPRLASSPTSRLAVIILGALILGVVALSLWTLQHETRLDRERQEALTLEHAHQAAAEVSFTISNVASDLRFNGWILQERKLHLERQHSIEGYLGTSDPYRVLLVFDQEGRLQDTFEDPVEPLPMGEGLVALASEFSRTVVVKPAGSLSVSASLPEVQGQALRAFGTSVRVDGQLLAIVVIVDTEALLHQLRALSGTTSRLLVLDPQGDATSLSDESVLNFLREKNGPSSPSAQMLSAMRQARSGLVELSPGSSEALGLGPDGALAVFVPVTEGPQPSWSIAVMSSLSVSNARNRNALLRLLATNAAIILLLVVLGGIMLAEAQRLTVAREQLRHAAQLEAAHRHNEQALAHLPAGVLVLSEQGRITAANRAARQWIAHPWIELPFEAAFKDAEKSSVALLTGLRERALGEGSARSTAPQPLTLSKEPGHYEIYMRLFQPPTPDAHMLVVIEDVSELSKLQSQLIQAEKMTTVGILSAGIAHEIGTPLGVVRGRSQYILEKLGPHHPEARNLESIIGQIDHITRSIRQVLNFSHAGSVASRVVSLPPLVRLVLELLETEAEQRKVALTSSIPEGLASVSGDPDRLQQVLVNLAMNALDACTPGGRVEVQASEENGWVRMEVVDNGIGIPEQIRHRVFDPFFTTKKGNRGTGLGLTVCHQIVREHQGAMEISSTPGLGTRVLVFLPAAGRQEVARG
jgi:signal transduction histidine kinase